MSLDLIDHITSNDCNTGSYNMTVIQDETSTGSHKVSVKLHECIISISCLQRLVTIVMTTWIVKQQITSN